MAAQASCAPSQPTEQELEDDTLWRELVEGNLAALDVLYERYSGLALGIATRMLSDPQGAEDVVQESFLQLWRRASSYDPERGSLRCWLLAIVHHRCIDVLRGRAVRPQTVAESDASAYPGSCDIWAEVDQRLARTTLEHALLRLPAEQQEAVMLGFFGGYTHVEIAERLGLPLGTVKGRLRLGLRRLRTLLDGLDLVTDPRHQPA